MRHLEDRELDDLHVVIRAFCKDEAGMSYKSFAGEVARVAEEDAIENGAGADEAKERAASAATLVGKFLTSKQNKAMHTFTPYCLAVLEETARGCKGGDSEIYIVFARAFAKGETGDYRKQEGLPAFIDQRARHLVNERRKNHEKLNAKPHFTQKLSRLYMLAAETFETHDDDVNAFDKRIGDSRYLAIRAHSRRADQYVVHGLRFAAHVEPEHSDLCYFSDKYTLRRSPEDPPFGRKSQGICFVEGQYLSAIARPDVNEAAFTYLHAKLPSMTLVDGAPVLKRFEAMISTVNTINQRFWATALCFRCKDKSEKHAKVGIFTFDGLLDLFDDDQRAELIAWRNEGRFKLMGL